jgi:hypothetical protein
VGATRLFDAGRGRCCAGRAKAIKNCQCLRSVLVPLQARKLFHDIRATCAFAVDRALTPRECLHFGPSRYFHSWRCFRRRQHAQSGGGASERWKCGSPWTGQRGADLGPGYNDGQRRDRPIGKWRRNEQWREHPAGNWWRDEQRRERPVGKWRSDEHGWKRSVGSWRCDERREL